MKKITLLLQFFIISFLDCSAQIHIQYTLGYNYDALEPYFDKQTMEIHFEKHHRGYINNLNNAVKGTEYELFPVKMLIENISKYNATVRNNAGGHWNHTFFWQILSPQASSGKPSDKLSKAIVSTYGSFDEFKKQFSDAANKRFGSGWAWLIVQNGKLVITSTPNQDNPLMDIAEVKGEPILGLDVWEHAYYLKYQNKRPDYTNAFFEIINWAVVSEKYEVALLK